MAEQNGGGGAASDPNISQLLLTLKRDTFQLAITGKTENFDEALAMLGIATRDFEARLRAAQVRQVIESPARGPFVFPHRSGD